MAEVVKGQFTLSVFVKAIAKAFVLPKRVVVEAERPAFQNALDEVEQRSFRGVIPSND